MKNLRKSIIKEARKLFSEFGFFGVSMSDIANQLGITKPALYYYFESKKELYLKVLEKAFNDLMKNLGKRKKDRDSSKKQFSKLLQNYLNFSLKEKNIIRSQLLKEENMDPEILDLVIKLRKKLRRCFIASLEKIVKISEKKISLDFLTSFVLGAMDRLVLEASFLGKKLDPEKKAHQILKALGLF